MKNKRKKRRGFRLKHVIILVLILYIGRTLVGQKLLVRDLTKKKLQEEEEIGQLKEDIRELNDEIKTKGSLEFIEKVARDDLGMVKPKEIIYVDKNKNRKHFLNFRK